MQGNGVTPSASPAGVLAAVDCAAMSAAAAAAAAAEASAEATASERRRSESERSVRSRVICSGPLRVDWIELESVHHS